MMTRLSRLFIPGAISPKCVLAFSVASMVLIFMVDTFASTHVRLNMLYIFPLSAIALHSKNAVPIVVVLALGICFELVTSHVQSTHPSNATLLAHIAISFSVCAVSIGLARIVRANHFSHAQRSLTDTLTKLPNRDMFQECLRQLIERGMLYATPLALLLIDLDEFKEVNDTLGHNAGDVLLIEVGQRITSCLRESSIRARLGGDEFAVLLSTTGDIANTEKIAKRLIASLAAPYRVGTETVHISASIGIALYEGHGVMIEDFLRHADQAMYAAKDMGRNRYCYFTPALEEAAQLRKRLVGDLRNAVEENQFELYYQPIVELATKRVHKAEALIRWHHPLDGLIEPAEFIHIAESSGLIAEIGEWVFKAAAGQVKRLRTTDEAFQISVNVSPRQLQGCSDIGSIWLSTLANLGLNADCMSIEITEGLLLDLDPAVGEQLHTFAQAGVQLALDDFGTGYSSLAYLKKFDIDYLKIDRSFVHNLETDPEDRVLCEAIIVMAHKLGLKVIAEGVETVAQRDILIAADCDFAQGYFYSKPIPVTEFEVLLLEMHVNRESQPVVRLVEHNMVS